jgi:hypothetical protein
MYWKTAWLRKVDANAPAATQPQQRPEAARLLPLLTVASRRPPADDGAELYRCQATELLRAAPELVRIRDLGQYVQDVRSGNASGWWALRTLVVALYNRMQGTRLRIRAGRRWGNVTGTATQTPTARTNLQPGDLVRVKSKAEVGPTLNADLLNRGMGFDAEMGRFCGKTARVARRIDRIIDERTGRMLQMKNPCIVLEGVVCEGAFNFNCPRAITPYWREIWLEKLDGGDSPVPHERAETAHAARAAE